MRDHGRRHKASTVRQTSLPDADEVPDGSAEVAAALNLSVPHTAVRIQWMQAKFSSFHSSRGGSHVIHPCDFPLNTATNVS
jgi:hypothetical protein